jgi:hypothetical protein
MSVKSQELRLAMVLQCPATCMSLNVNSLCSVKHYAKQYDKGLIAELHTTLIAALDGGSWYAACPS